MQYEVEIVNVTANFAIDGDDTMLDVESDDMTQLMLIVIIVVSCVGGLLVVFVSLYCIIK